MWYRLKSIFLHLYLTWGVVLCGLREVKQFSCDVFFFNTQSWRTQPSFGHYCVSMHTNLFKILCFSCRGKSRDIVYQRICLFLWLIFTQHGLFYIQLTVFSALSRLTDLGIYDITRCRIWLLTIFHIPYIHFQPELRKVTSQKWYLSFFVQYISNRTSVEQSIYFRQSNFVPWCKYGSYWQCFLYQRLRQTRWLRISYCKFPQVFTIRSWLDLLGLV